MGQGCGCQLERCDLIVSRSLSQDEVDGAEDSAVLLNIYDLTEEFKLPNSVFQEVVALGGAFHAGVEVYGREWSFGYDGVHWLPPRTHDVHVYRESILIGHTKYAPEEVALILEDEMFSKWPGRSYDLLSRNCCTFSRSFCKRLTGDIIPDWVDRLPRLLSAASKPVLGVADAAKGVGKFMESAPGSHAFAQCRGDSIESVGSEFSLYSQHTLATSRGPTPKYDNSEPSFGLRSSIESI